MLNIAIAVVAASVLAADVRDDQYFKITVVDEATNRGVPLIELRTVNDLRYYTDSAGVVAFNEPGLMDQTVFFHVKGHGYAAEPDGFGIQGRRLETAAGGSATIKIRRTNVAERLYRVTGAGIYAESHRIGETPPIKRPLLNAQVLGSDSVQAAVFNERLYWFWGDTTRAAYPLGNFHAPGATSQLPKKGGLDPSVGVDLEYFVGDDGFAKPTCKMPGEGLTWIDGLAVTTDGGSNRLFAHFLKVKPPLSVYQHGIAEFDTASNQFVFRAVFPDDSAVLPAGHSFAQTDGETNYIYFGKPFPIVRVRAAASSVVDPTQYEAFTCLTEGSKDEPNVDRDEKGRVRYGWKRAVPPIDLELQQKLVKDGKLKPSECLYQVRDIETNKPIKVHHGSVFWNEHRRRWILIASELYGSSVLGEVWYSEGDAPQGPWAFARKIVTHDKQSFYNPRQHPFFDEQGGRRIYFEGTYTHSFSGNDERTPRYEYNQIMYRLDLDDHRLNLPVAVYRETTNSGEQLSVRNLKLNDFTFRPVAWWACERKFESSIPVFATTGDLGVTLSTADASENLQPLFFAHRPTGDAPAGCVPLYEWKNENGTRRYVAGNEQVPGFKRAKQPLAHVWSPSN